MADDPPEPSDRASPADRELEAGHEPLGAGIDYTDPNSPLARYYMTAGDVVGVLLICLCVTFFGHLHLWHSDIWGHELFGEWILDHRALPDHEPFSPYSDKSQKPLHTQWLAQTAYASVARLSEWLGRGDPTPERTVARTAEMLRSLHQLLTALQFVFLWLAFRRFGGSKVWANVALVLAWMLMITTLSVQRPQGFGLVCFALLLYCLSRPELPRRSIIGLPTLFAVWANLHGSFVVGLGFFFLFTLGRIWERWRLEPAGGLRAAFRETNVRRLLTAWALSVLAAGACNPHGPMIYYDVATFSSRPNLDIVTEWQPLDASGRGFARYLILAGITLILWRLGRYAGTVWVLVCMPFALWPFVQQRGMVWWTVLFPWLFSYLGLQAARRLSLPTLPGGVPSFRMTLLAGSIVVLALIWQQSLQATLNGKRLRTAPEVLSPGTPWKLGLELQCPPEMRGRWYPELAKALDAWYPGGRFRGAIFSSEVQGDYLLRVAPPGCAVLFYSHVHFFPPDHVRGWVRAELAEGDWRGWLKERGVNLIVVQPDRVTELCREIRQDPDWFVVEDEAGAPHRQEGDTLFIALRKQPL